MNKTDPRHPLNRLRHHVTGAIERGEGEAIVEVPAPHVLAARQASVARHTPTPWAEQEMPRGSNDVGYNDRITDTDGEGKTICEFPYGLNADSAFIVRACNNYDAMAAMLKRCERAIPNHARNETLLVELHALNVALANAGAV